MSAYVVMIRERVNNPEEMARYAQLAPSARAGHHITPIAFYGDLMALEGPRPDGVVILQFASVDEARGWYESAAYQDAATHRHLGADYRVFVIEGVAPPTDSQHSLTKG
ncbi:DUF1330 domain-containing protein [Robbsia andropogonis]|uniref:DUF1330 domain-containing protein n=1 Tax=Robbsia andropogonis TaxID=28092 RepID=UPI002A6A6C71|nr:DUF1330 domain-containing protein [Robbsia andropogonis]